MKKSPYDKIYEKKCVVCGEIFLLVKLVMANALIVVGIIIIYRKRMKMM